MKASNVEAQKKMAVTLLHVSITFELSTFAELHVT